MLSLLELFSELLNFFVRHLDLTITWVSPFRIRVETRSHTAANPPLATPETIDTLKSQLNADDNSAGSYSDFNPLLADSNWVAIGEFLRLYDGAFAALNTAFNTAENSFDPAAQSKNTSQTHTNEQIEHLTGLEFELATGESIELIDNAEQSPYWYELIPDLESNSSDLFYPVRTLLDQRRLNEILRSSNPQMGGPGEWATANNFTANWNEEEIQVGMNWLGNWADLDEQFGIDDSTGETQTRLAIEPTSDATEGQVYRWRSEPMNESIVANNLTFQSDRYNPATSDGSGAANLNLSTGYGVSVDAADVGAANADRDSIDFSNRSPIFPTNFLFVSNVEEVPTTLEITTPDNNVNAPFGTAPFNHASGIATPIPDVNLVPGSSKSNLLLTGTSIGTERIVQIGEAMPHTTNQGLPG